MNLLINSDKLTTLADSFREKLNTNEQFTIDEMTDTVEELKYITNPYISLEKSEGSDTVDTAVYNGFETITYNDTVERDNIIIKNGPTSVGLSSSFTSAERTSGFIKKVVLPSSITSIVSRAFAYFSSLTDINIPDTITSIDVLAFRGCTSLNNISFPQSITRLESGVLYETGISNFYIYDTVTYIGPNSLGKTNIRKIFLPSTVSTIGATRATESPFSECNTALEIYTDAASKPNGWGSYFNKVGINGSSTATVHYGVSREEYEEIINTETEV